MRLRSAVQMNPARVAGALVFGGAAVYGRGDRDQLPADRWGQGSGDRDFVMTADEVNPVLQALASAGITVTALHNHLLNEQRRLFFAHLLGQR
ncbi:MAG TPA: DUF1259 domain-containing protein [Gemmatimonadales bacterium]|nr:DUF1259 domain-containing protein [Gemmatimonadales bacterium]